MPKLSTNALLSIKVIVDNGYTTVFHSGSNGTTVYDTNDKQLDTNLPNMLQGCQNSQGLWVVPMTMTEPATHLDVAMNMYDRPSMPEVIQFLHAALGFPTKATLLAAIQHGNLQSFPGLTTDAVNKHFPESDKMQKGHMHQQGVCSTKVPDEDAMLNFKHTPGAKHKDVSVGL